MDSTPSGPQPGFGEAGLIEAIDGALSAFLAQAETAADADWRALVAEVRRLVDAGGKRIRPVFCYWGFRAAGGTGDGIFAAAASVELVHTFALVHDDIMDGADVRRGQPTSAVVFSDGVATRLGLSAAILAGDLAMVLADMLLASSGFTAGRLVRARELFDRMRVETIAGQFLDVTTASAGDADETTARRIAALKTGGYTIAYPLLIGARLGDAPDRVEEALEGYGRPLGEAFQLRDDILGVFGDPAATGKDTESDLREGKQTILVAAARRLAGPDANEVLDAALGNDQLAPEAAAQVRDLIRSCGALDHAEDLVEHLRTEALDALAQADLRDEVRGALALLADRVTRRSS